MFGYDFKWIEDSIEFIRKGQLENFKRTCKTANTVYNGHTFLEYALNNRQPDIALWLIDQGADVNWPYNSQLDRPLHLALRFNMLRVFDKLYKAGAKGNHIISSKGDYYFHKLMIALNVNAADNVLYALAKEANDNGAINHVGAVLTKKDGVTKIHPTTIIHHVIANNKIPFAKWLINNTKIDPNISVNGKTPIDVAVEHLKLTVMEMMYEKGSNITKGEFYKFQLQILNGLGLHAKVQELTNEIIKDIDSYDPIEQVQVLNGLGLHAKAQELTNKIIEDSGYTSADLKNLLSLEGEAKMSIQIINNIEENVSRVQETNDYYQSLRLDKNKASEKALLRAKIQSLRKVAMELCDRDEACNNKIEETKSNMTKKIENSPSSNFVKFICNNESVEAQFVAEQMCEREETCTAGGVKDLSVCEFIS